MEKRRSLKEQKLNQNEGQAAGVRAAGSGWQGGASGCLGRRLHGVRGEREGEKPMNTLTGGEGVPGTEDKTKLLCQSTRERGPGAGCRGSGVCHVKYAGL